MPSRSAQAFQAQAAASWPGWNPPALPGLGPCGRRPGSEWGSAAVSRSKGWPLGTPSWRERDRSPADVGSVAAEWDRLLIPWYLLSSEAYQEAWGAAFFAICSPSTHRGWTGRTARATADWQQRQGPTWSWTPSLHSPCQDSVYHPQSLPTHRVPISPHLVLYMLLPSSAPFQLQSFRQQ